MKLKRLNTSASFPGKASGAEGSSSTQPWDKRMVESGYQFMDHKVNNNQRGGRKIRRGGAFFNH